MKLRFPTFREFSILLIVWTGMWAIIDLATESYTAAGIQMAVGLVYIWLLENRGE